MATLSDARNGSAAVTHHSTEADDQTLLTADDVAAMLKVSKSWVYEHTRLRGARGSGLPFIKVGRLVRYRRSDVEAWLCKCTVGRLSA